MSSLSDAITAVNEQLLQFAVQCMAARRLHGDFPHTNSGHLLLWGMRASTDWSVLRHSSTD